METKSTPIGVRALVADYIVLNAFDRERVGRYGDMAAYRRMREMRKLRDAILRATMFASPPFDVELHLEGNGDITHHELAAAWKRVAVPKLRRLERETYRHGTRETRATLAAWRATSATLEL